MVLEGASTLKKEMITEFHGKLLCLKYDLATRLGRHFIALNVQYCNDQKQVCKTLAVREVKSVAIGNELSRIILDILNDFDIELSQIYSITTDNGSNVLATSNLISNAVGVELDQMSLNDDLDNIEDIIAAEELLQASLFDLKTALEGVHLVRCSAHTLALAVDDCIGRKSDETTKKLLTNARNVVCTLRNSIMRKELRKKFLPMAIIDVKTRWSSTYDMLKRLLELSAFCQEFETLNEKLKLATSE